MNKIPSSSYLPLEYLMRDNRDQQHESLGQPLMRQTPFSLKSGREVHQSTLTRQNYGYHTMFPRSGVSNPRENAWKMGTESAVLREDDIDGKRRTTTSPQNNTIFVGNLALSCDEEGLFNLFHHFGEIELIQLKKGSSNSQRSNLSYGFIKFASHESAVRALEEVNGFPFYGRNLRLGWAEDRGSNQLQQHPVLEVFASKKTSPTAQIHVSFIAKNVVQQITELELSSVFHQFGNIVDVVIKKSNFNRVAGVQSGYGFIHFSMTEEGIQSALTAVEVVNHQVIEGISFDCMVTHELKAHLFRLRSHRGPPFPVSEYVKKSNVVSENQIGHLLPFHFPLHEFPRHGFGRFSTIHGSEPRHDSLGVLPYSSEGSIISDRPDLLPKSGGFGQLSLNSFRNGTIGDSRLSFHTE